MSVDAEPTPPTQTRRVTGFADFGPSAHVDTFARDRCRRWIFGRTCCSIGLSPDPATSLSYRALS